MIGRFLIVSFSALLLGVIPLSAQRPADIVLRNGKILTVDANFSTAQAVAVQGRRIAAVGANADVMKLAGPNTLVIDLKGRTVIPGLIDTHLHITGGTAAEPIPEAQQRTFRIDWAAIRNKQDFLNQVRGLMERYKPPAGEWLGFNNGLSFNSGESTKDQATILYDNLNRYDLDTVLPNNPALFTMGIPAENLLFVNSKALDIMMTKHGDYLKKYGRFWLGSNGQPDGHLEPPATRLLLNLYAPRLTPEQQAPGIRRRLEELSAQGATTLSTKIRQDGAEAYQLLEKRGEQTVRLAYGIGFDYFGSGEGQVIDLSKYEYIVGSGSDMNWISSFAPSSIDGASTRACTNLQRTSGYLGIDDWFPVGQCHMDAEYRGGSGRAQPASGNYFRDWVFAMGRYGLRFANVHVAGDRSVKLMLDLVEQIQKEHGKLATRNWQLDHCEFVDPADGPRAARLGVGFSCFIDNSFRRIQATADAYGEKTAHTYVVPAKTLMDAGVKVVFQTDGGPEWPSIELFITRKDAKGKVWGPQERLDRPTLLKMVTRWAADYVLRPDRLGSIEVGKLADIAVLDRDFLTIPEDEISEIESNLTIMDGRIVYVNKNFAEEHNLRPAGAVISTYQELLRRPDTEQRGGGLDSGG
jgi:predicted amidohydrolase YtcJ